MARLQPLRNQRHLHDSISRSYLRQQRIQTSSLRPQHHNSTITYSSPRSHRHATTHPPTRTYSTHTESALPRIAQPSTWQSIIPRAWRQPRSPSPSTSPTTSPTRSFWSIPQFNPATYFIWISILIGSQAIKILSLKHDFQTYTRRADLKLARLKEIVDRLQAGENLSQDEVTRVLGTGDEVAEQEWEEALREIEEEEILWQRNKKRRREESDLQEKERRDADPVNGEFEREVQRALEGDGTKVEKSEVVAAVVGGSQVASEEMVSSQERRTGDAANSHGQASSPRAPGFY